MKTYCDFKLFTPGPATVPQRVLDAYAKPLVHHRTPAMSAMLSDLERKLQWLFNTQELVLPLHVTGRGGLEANIANLLSAGDEIISLCNGRFAQMTAEIAEAYGIVVHRICTNWEAIPDMAEVEAAARQFPASKLITMCMNESSTGVMMPIEPVAAIAHAHDMACVVDAVSIAGGIRIDFDSCGADALVTASQKCLMCSPGMAFAVLSERARALCAKSTLPKFFTNYAEIRHCMMGSACETPGSTAVTAVYGLTEALTMMQEEGRDEIFARHAQNARAIRAAVRALGFSLFPVNIPEENRSVTLTTFTAGELPVDINALRKALEDQYGLAIAGGTGSKMSGKVLRIGHMGSFYRRDVLMLIACLEDCLRRQGALRKPGSGLAACLEAYGD